MTLVTDYFSKSKMEVTSLPVLLLCISITTGQSSSYSSYDNTEDVECQHPDAVINFTTIVIDEPLVERNGSNWTLKYNITWQPPDQNDGQVDFGYKVKVSYEPNLQRWSPHECYEGLLTDPVDVNNPFYEVDLPFTHKALFQVLPAVNGSVASDMLTLRNFETPGN